MTSQSHAVPTTAYTRKLTVVVMAPNLYRSPGERKPLPAKSRLALVFDIVAAHVRIGGDPLDAMHAQRPHGIDEHRLRLEDAGGKTGSNTFS